MEYKLYRGYVLGPGEQNPAYDIYEVNIFLNVTNARLGTPYHTSESELEAQGWIDRQIDMGSVNYVESTQEDVDELNSEGAGAMVMTIEVNPHGVSHNVSYWCQDHEQELKNEIKRAVKSLGFGGVVKVRVNY